MLGYPNNNNNDRNIIIVTIEIILVLFFAIPYGETPDYGRRIPKKYTALTEEAVNLPPNFCDDRAKIVQDIVKMVEKGHKIPKNWSPNVSNFHLQSDVPHA